MAEYIKLEDVIREIEQINPVDYGAMWDYEAHHWAGECLRDCKEAIDSIPAADVAPVVHGRWIPHDRVFGDDFLVCSKCQFVSEDRSTRRYYHYCPNCGAKMDGGNENV